MPLVANRRLRCNIVSVRTNDAIRVEKSLPVLDSVLIRESFELWLAGDCLEIGEDGADTQLAGLGRPVVVAIEEDGEVVRRAGILLEDAIKRWCTVHIGI